MSIGCEFITASILPHLIKFTNALLSCSFHDSAPVVIGSRVHIGPGVSIQTESHGVDIRSRRAGLLYARPVRILDDCWVGAQVTILPGVTIGRGCTIGARAVVTRDITPF